MNFVLIAAVLLINGATDQQSAMYETEAECLKDLPSVAANIEQYNASGTHDKVVKFAAVCMPLQRPAQGREV
jgi:hypothetical protein